MPYARLEVPPASVSVPDEVLVERTRSGDLGSFETLVERHRDVVYRVAARIVGAADAEDVAQDAFLRAFHRLSLFRGESSFRAWLLRITHNAALNALTRRRVPPAAEQETESGEPMALEAAERTPVEELEVTERRARLAAKLREIQPPHRSVLVLRDIEGLSYEEIAQVMDTPIGTVKGRLHRARRELIEILRRNTYEWELPE